jgi:hypothetical protein
MAGQLPYGLQAMLKDGHKHLSGLDEAVYKNIEAGKQLSQIARTSMGPNGRAATSSLRCLIWPAAVVDEGAFFWLFGFLACDPALPCRHE